MSVELNKITGLMLPKHISNSCDCEDGEGCRGYDKAITQQGKKKIRLNREKTVKFIGNLFGRVFEQDKYAIVDAFEAKLEGLLEVVE